MDSFIVDFFYGIYDIWFSADVALEESVTTSSGMYLFIITITVALLYYYFFTRFWLSWVKLGVWLLVMLFNSVLVFLATLMVWNTTILDTEYGFEGLLPFCFVNAFYSLLLFIVLSLIMKLFAKNSKHIPF